MLHLTEDPAFWLAIAFVLFVVLVGRKILPLIGQALDKRSAEIEQELNEAQRLREEAQSTLLAYQKRQREILQEAEDLLVNAKREAEAMREEAEQALKLVVERRIASANEKIARAEEQAVQLVKDNMVDIAITAAQSLIVRQVQEHGDEEQVALAISDIERVLH